MFGQLIDVYQPTFLEDQITSNSLKKINPIL